MSPVISIISLIVFVGVSIHIINMKRDAAWTVQTGVTNWSMNSKQEKKTRHPIYF